MSCQLFEKTIFTTAEICAAAEKVCGHNNIDGAQRIGSLWRIYPCSREGRNKLLVQGFILRGVHLNVKSQNPFVVRNVTDGVTDEREVQTPATKLVIGNVPLSFSDDDLLKTVKQLQVSIRSKLILERDRDENGKMTHWKTGRRILYIGVPNVPLQKNVQIGPFRASLYHKEQKLIREQKDAECRNCLRKGHQTRKCQNPIKCQQCYCDGHKAGDPECKLPASSETKGSTDSPTTDTTDMLEIMDTKTGDKQKQDVKKTEKKQNKANSVVSHDRSRPHDKKKQTTLGTYRRSGSQSIKRPRSKDSLSSQSDKQMKLQEQNDHETDVDESKYCEPPDHIA
ncbi:hypothetical protein ACOMHN_006605 [Nucella lapillus]